MGASVVLDDTSLEAVPGQELRVCATVSNTGNLVDELTVDVVGVPAAWVSVEPAAVRLLPGKRGEVQLVLTVPRESASSPGLRVVGVRARSSQDPSGSCVEEAVLEVLPFTEVDAELVPRTCEVRGLRRARYVLAVDNRGNAPVVVGVDAVDPDQNLVLAVERAELTCPPGSATFVTVRARSRDRYWKGPPVTRGFLTQVSRPGEPEPLTLDGVLVQVAAVPEALLRLAVRAAVLGAVGVALVLLVLAPRLSGATSKEAELVARSSAADAVAPVADSAEQAAAAAEQARRAAEAAVAAIPAPLPAPSPTPGRTAAPASAAPAAAAARPRPFSARLAVAEGSYGPALRVPTFEQLSLTGFVLQPNGDRGEMALLRSGRTLVTTRLGVTEVVEFPTPVVFAPGSTVQLTVLCRNPEPDACSTAVLLTGTVLTVVGATPEPGATARPPSPQPEPARTADPLPSEEPTPDPSPTPAPVPRLMP